MSDEHHKQNVMHNDFETMGELSEEELGQVVGGTDEPSQTANLNLTISSEPQQLGLLLPAVQAAREAARR
jgi:hypothetical protein